MSTLALIEKDIVSTLSALSDPALRSVAAVTGPVRAPLLARLARRPTPAAFALFLNELLRPEAAAADKGPRFAILLAARRLTADADARNDDPGGFIGVHSALAAVRSALDDHVIDPPNVILKPLEQHVVASDERQAIYQVTYVCRYA